MKNIGLIDDKDKARRAFMLQLKLELEKLNFDWEVIASKPFKDIETYRQWILENEISVLIIDERLDEEKLDDGTYVKDFGSEVVERLRYFFKDMPIYCVTNIEITESLRKSLPNFNLILSRSRFDSDISNYLNSFIKSGIIFYTEFRKELERLGELAEKLAKGVAQDSEIQEMNSLQTRLCIPYLTENLTSREKYLSKLELQINDIKQMQKALMDLLNNKK